MSHEARPVFWGTEENRREVGVARVIGNHLVVRINDTGLLNWVKTSGVANVGIGRPQRKKEIYDA